MDYLARLDNILIEVVDWIPFCLKSTLFGSGKQKVTNNFDTVKYPNAHVVVDIRRNDHFALKRCSNLEQK